MGLGDPPLDPDATDQLAAALGQPSALPEFPAVPDYWLGGSDQGPMPAAGIDASAGAPPIAPGDQGPPPGAPQGPPPIDAALAGGLPPEQPPPPMPPMPAPGGPAPDAIAGRVEQSLGGPPEPVFTGDATAGATPGQQLQQAAQHYQAHPDELLAKLTSGAPLSETDQRYLNDFKLRDGPGFAELEFRLGDAKLKHLAAEQHRIADRDWQVQQANLEMRNRAIADAQRKTAQLDARATELANTKVGQLSIGQRLAGVAAAVVGGLYQGKTGSARNPGLDAFNETINRDIENQKMELANKREALGLQRSAIGEEYARSGDAYQAAETMRLAALKHADDLLATQQQDYAADGTRGLQLAQLRAGIAGQQQQALKAVHDDIFSKSMKVQDAARQQQLADEAGRHNRAEEALARAKEARESAGANDKARVFSVDELRALMPPGTPIPPIGMTQKDLSTWLENAKTGQATSLGQREYLIGDARPTRDADGNIIGIQSQPLTQKDGTPFLAPSTDSAKELRNQKGGVDVTSQLVEEMTAGIKKYGGSTEFFKSPEWQTMQANKESLLFALHQAYNVTGFRPGVLEQMEKALGGQDPTKLTLLETNAVPGLEAAKRTVLQHFNANLRAAQYSGPEYSPPSATDGTQLPQLGDRTAGESAPGALEYLKGSLRLDASALTDPLGGNPQAGTEPEPGNFGPTGLSPSDTAKVQDMVRRFKVGTPATKEKVVTALSSALGAGRPTLNTGILGLVNGEAPELYHALLGALPADERERELHDQAAIGALQHQLPGALPAFPPPGGH